MWTSSSPWNACQGLNADSLFDLSVNCADIPGAETINILATKERGNGRLCQSDQQLQHRPVYYRVHFAPIDIRCADGYLEAYDEFDIEIVKDLIPYIENAVVRRILCRRRSVLSHQQGTRLLEASGARGRPCLRTLSESRAMAAVLNDMLTVAKYDCNVLITGDTGVGKEKVANIIHKNSNRKMQPFIKVNCASISPTLIESNSLDMRGAFTGANSNGKKGYFELADNGAIFLTKSANCSRTCRRSFARDSGW